MSLRCRLLVFVFLSLAAVNAQTPPNSVNPTIVEIVEQVSEERIAQNLRRLESFETRYILSEHDHPTRGIGAARKWIREQFESYGPRLEVSEQEFHVDKGERVSREVDVANVIAVLPGKVHPDRYVLITAHYDTVNQIRKPVPPDPERVQELLDKDVDRAEAERYVELFPRSEVLGGVDADKTAAQSSAPGVTDDGSGTAAVMELARVMSQHEFDKSLVFIAFAAEEVGLIGSKAYAAAAAAKGMRIEGVFNNDIIGSTLTGNGRVNDRAIRAFADGPEDSPGRALLRYLNAVGERYVPSLEVDMIFRRDRFGRGGDHTSFQVQNFPAVRLTTPSENYQHQHNATDTFENVATEYVARVARVNAAAAASLALAPTAPTTNYVFETGERKGDRLPMLSRGESLYDASLRWLGDADDIAGYAIVLRKTTASDWEREIWVGDVDRYTLSDFSIDDIVIGVKAVDKDGNESPVSAYLEPIRADRLRPASALKE